MPQLGVGQAYVNARGVKSKGKRVQLRGRVLQLQPTLCSADEILMYQSMIIPSGRVSSTERQLGAKGVEGLRV